MAAHPAGRNLTHRPRPGKEPTLPGNRTGYVYGVNPRRGHGGHLWLTVPGSYHQRPILAAAPEQAVRTAPFADVLALVEEVPHDQVASGYGYRVIQLLT